MRLELGEEDWKNPFAMGADLSSVDADLMKWAQSEARKLQREMVCGRKEGF